MCPIAIKAPCELKELHSIYTNCNLRLRTGAVMNRRAQYHQKEINNAFERFVYFGSSADSRPQGETRSKLFIPCAGR